MKKSIFIFFFSLLFFLANAQQKKDSTSKKQRFISVNFGGGIGWRKYKSVDETLVLWDPNEDGETRGPSYGVALNYGFTKKRLTHAFGIVYDYVKYGNYNNQVLVFTGINDPTYTYTYKYSYTHYFLSLSYSLNYYIDKHHNWNIGAEFKAGWILQYTQKIYDYESPVFTEWYAIKHERLRFEKHAVAWAGFSLGRKLFETKKIKLSLELHANVSSPVGIKGVERNYYEPGNINPYAQPSKRTYYESKPHYLLVPSLQFNLQYKL